MRDNKVGQGDRSRNGSRFQKAMHIELKEFMENSGLEGTFSLVGAKEIPVTVISGKSKTIQPDHVITKNGTPVVFFGDKKSFRERWKVDDRDATLAKLAYPGCYWIEITYKEKPTDSTAKIVKYLEGILKQSEFDILCSTAIADSMSAMWKQLKTHLISIS